MVKKYNKELLKKGILEFDTSLYVLNPEKSFASLILPYSTLKELGIVSKKDILTVTITKNNK